MNYYHLLRLVEQGKALDIPILQLIEATKKGYIKKEELYNAVKKGSEVRALRILQNSIESFIEGIDYEIHIPVLRKAVESGCIPIEESHHVIDAAIKRMRNKRVEEAVRNN